MKFIVELNEDEDESPKDVALTIEEALRDYGYSVTAHPTYETIHEYQKNK